MFFYKRRQRVSYLAQGENARICRQRGEAPSNTKAYRLLPRRFFGKDNLNLVIRAGIGVDRSKRRYSGRIVVKPEITNLFGGKFRAARNPRVSPLEIEPGGPPESDLLNLSDVCVPIMVF